MTKNSNTNRGSSSFMESFMECGDSSPPSFELQRGDEPPHSKKKSWHHGPMHWLEERGIYMVTSGTYLKYPHFAGADRLNFLESRLFEVCEEYGWRLQAWAILANHYHFVALSPNDPQTLRRMLAKLHMTTSKAVNALDGTPGRKVWFQYLDSLITYEKSYLARLRYVNENAVKHGLVTRAVDYPWCSASWFHDNTDPALRQRVEGMLIDRVNVHDDY